jgi:hypothetical protein
MLRGRLALVGVGLFSFASGLRARQAARAAESEVWVRTAEGRTVQGAVDARTDARTLWVRKSDDGIVLTSAVAWDRVQNATLNGQAIDVSRLRDRRAELASTAPRLEFSGASNPANATGAMQASYTSPIGAPQVRNLEILAAHLVNLDRDVEPDGIEVTVAAIGDDGSPRAVNGDLQVVLYGERRPAMHSLVEFGELDRWTQLVRVQDFVQGAATYVLRFRNTGPEWQFDLLPDAVLNARLGATGHGDFEASTPVYLRPFNPLRDNLQLLEETRFLPGELHGRNPHQRLKPENGLWLHWTR